MLASDSGVLNIVSRYIDNEETLNMVEAKLKHIHDEDGYPLGWHALNVVPFDNFTGSNPIELFHDGRHYAASRNIMAHPNLSSIVQDSLPDNYGHIPDRDFYMTGGKTAGIHILGNYEPNTDDVLNFRKAVLSELWEKRKTDDAVSVEVSLPKAKAYIIGMKDILLTRNDEEEKPIAFYQHLERYVLPEHRREGYGTALLEVMGSTPILRPFSIGSGFYSQEGYETRYKAYDILKLNPELTSKPSHSSLSR